MTVKQMQCLLTFLGYDTGGVDGISGVRTRAALADFRSAAGVTEAETAGALQAAVAAWAEKTGDLWNAVSHFSRGEFACRCGGAYCDGFPAEPEESLVRGAEELRVHFGVPITVSSGVRCPEHNARVGGVSNSRHLTGKAMDFAVAGKTAEQVLPWVRLLPQVRYAYAIDEHFVHMDVE